MNSQKIFIYEYDTLFNIIVEIKDYLSFDVININKENLHLIKNDFENNYLVVSQLGNNYSKNDLVIENLPIKIKKLIQNINLRFLEKTFDFQSDIKIGNYTLDLNERRIIQNDKTLNLTEREINLIIFLKNSQAPVKIDKLQKEVWAYGTELETHTVETHIYRLRKKIKEKFNDENFIISLKHGYQIN